MSYRVVFLDHDQPPMFERSDEPPGRDVFATFAEAKDSALWRMRDARDRLREAIAETRRMTVSDVR